MKSADSRPIWRRIDAFMLAESLDGQPAYARTQEKILEDGGVYDAVDSKELVMMKVRMMRHKQRKMKEHQG